MLSIKIKELKINKEKLETNSSEYFNDDTWLKDHESYKYLEIIETSETKVKKLTNWKYEKKI